VLEPIDERHTRLITRNRISPPPGVSAAILTGVLDVAAFIMVHRWLHVLKERAEGLAEGKYR